jgi:hypothetical protein
MVHAQELRQLAVLFGASRPRPIGRTYGEDMLRFVSAAAVLLAVSSTAVAGEHYVETWNPPEARIGRPVGKCKPKTGKTALLSHGMTRAVPHRIADPLAKASAGRHAGNDASKKAVNPRFIDIPRIVTPEGNILQVSAGHRSVSVVR